MADHPNFRDLRSPDERVFCAHHMRTERGQEPALIHPAKAIMFGTTKTESTGDALHPHITIYAKCEPFGVMFIANADELTALGETLIAHAEKMRAAADVEAVAVIERARNL